MIQLLKRPMETFPVLTGLLVASAAAAQDVPLVCSVQQGLECDASLDCAVPLRDPPPPTFIHVDVEGGVITLLAPESRRGEATQIGSTARQGGNTILTGAEAGRGWAMVIGDESLAMTLTMSEDRTGFVVFGACLPADETSP